MEKVVQKTTVFGIFTRETFRHSWLFLIILIATFVMEGAELTSPLYLRNFFNTLVTHTPSAATFHALVIIILSLAVFYVLDWVSGQIQIFALQNLETQVMVDLHLKAFDYMLGHSYQFFTSKFTGTLTRRVGKFARAYETIFDSIMLQFLPTTIFVVGAITILFIRNHALGTILAAWSILFVLFQVYMARRLQPLRKASAVEDSKVTGALSDAISNQNTISLFSGYEHEHVRFDAAIKLWRKVTLRSWYTDEYVWAGLGFFIIIINLALLYAAAYYWQRGLLTIGDFVLIQAYLITTIQQLVGINRNLRRFYDGYADASEMVEVLAEPYDVQDRSNDKLGVRNGTITFNSVRFGFNADRVILKDMTFKIEGGEKVALVGPSGAGKSTVIKLLLRFYDVNSGEILIDDHNISLVSQASLRDAIAFVPQEPILFHRSLMENIRYGNRNATDAEVIEAAKKAHCHEFISGFPEGYDTFVGERGVKLSGGERQRVAIARAILKNAPILVLDEATSSLDSESEALIQDALKVLMEGKTVVVIAHRLSTIMTMDRIIVIDGGKIVAEGSHDELLQEDGLYKKLWSIQAGGFITDKGDEAPEAGDTEEEDVD